MDSNGFHFELDYNNLDLLLVPGYMEEVLQIQDNKIKNPFTSTKLQQVDNRSNRRVVIPTFFHPSEDEERHTLLSEDMQQELQKPSQLPPLSPVKSMSEVFLQTSTSDFRTTFDAATPASDLTIQSTVINQGQNLLHNSSSSFDFNSTIINEWSPEEIGAVFIVCLMIPFIICSNLLVIFSVIRFRRLHTPTNYFITSLAAVDILVGIITPLVIAVQIFQNGGGRQDMSDAVVCLLPNRILMMSCGVSLLNLATIAYDRHTALICPLEYVNIMTTRKVSVLMFSSWIYSAFIVWLPLAVGWYEPSVLSSQCSADHLHKKAHILFIFAIFVPSCAVILICYSRIFLVARYHARSIAAVQFAVHRRLQVRFMIKDTKYAKTLALVIGGFLALWLPYLVLNFIKTVCSISSNQWLETYLILLAVLNSGINPWIYAFKNNEFQAAFKRMAREHCKSPMCYRWQEKRGSLVSCVSSTTPRLSRTDSRMASTILDGQPEKVAHRNLDFLNCLENDSSEYNHPDLYQSSMRGRDVERTFNNHFNREISTVCEIEYTSEDGGTRNNTLTPSMKEDTVSSHTSCTRTSEYNNKTIAGKDEFSHPLRLSILNNYKIGKDNLAQFKRIKKKGAEIIRSTSALSAIRPNFLPIHRRPTSSLPSSPVQSHNPFKPSLKPFDKAPETCKVWQFHPFRHQNSSTVSPASNLSPISMA